MNAGRLAQTGQIFIPGHDDLDDENKPGAGDGEKEKAGGEFGDSLSSGERDFQSLKDGRVGDIKLGEAHIFEL
ncbi:MAG: hypothetical protein G01um101416_282 [Microgenomates group bacterium Gr01-1014_16]|nr:MAG: hypothetical protein G01um101416_282 [Microgenomates group bacterium Gr01-1014_16]